MTPISYRLLHALPGRLRLRVPALSEVGVGESLRYWLDAQDGVEDVRINRAARSLVVDYDPRQLAQARLLAWLDAFGPRAGASQMRDAPDDPSIAPLVRNVLTLLLLPLLPRPAQHVATYLNIGSKLLKGADTLIHEGVKVEVLDALAVGLSASRGKLYTANITDLLLTLGEYLEERTQQQSDRLLRRLLRPAPATAWVERDGQLVQIPGDQVLAGELLVVGVGETIPVDGRVVEGVAMVNQAAVTGEDMPIAREAPKRVVAGSVLVEGRLRIEATRVGDDTTTARVARFIQESLDKTSETQRMADELADTRVYLTLGSAGAVYALTRDLTRVQSVFLVDYSCALKLGTPVAFKSGLYQAANHGVLIKGGEAMERLAGIDTLVFDKTGTLTHSELEVTDVVVLDPRCGESEEVLLAMVASVEEHATHPLSQAVVEAARERDLQHISHGEVDYMVAHGLSARLDCCRILVGSRHYLEEHEGVRFESHEARIARLLDEGKTLLYVASERGPMGLIALRDTLREDAEETLRRLRTLGIERLVMISGDRQEKAEALGRTLRLDQVHGEVRPEEKAALIIALQREGRKVGFVGDGINDGPALVAADVGIAMSRGADLARASADIVLTDDRLIAVADAREIALGTMSIIRTNFNATVGINTAIMAGALLGWLSPVASALLHNGTTLGVLVHALRGARPAQREKAIEVE
ncbi:heavy metal translocating P-type ATPase [Thiocystis violascens]|uniref:P-type Zn(2+) transporter n=1 Tax=Thiocystis violascens (strain ATCC 17096 / DSM 198 / 6111) TaxID=765911 RepID=I3Y8M7_THIV6|nr:heavy metal translocating P-type ATPase [Thiocystis violascens]AFL73345.1 heavy metal translocating P-type ATPase [Thiocystis violascens DSM 198]